MDSYDLTKLTPQSFEHLVNTLAFRVLGAGTTGFGPGPDGGRDGYFEGEAPYPSSEEKWSGRWYIQSKFHRPHLSTDAQKWLLERISEELEAFSKPGSRRIWPDNWILASNVDPSGALETGTFDRARSLVESKRPELVGRFHIWGGDKIISLLHANPDIAAAYSHFLTPGNVLAELYAHLRGQRGEIEAAINHLVIRGMREHQHTRLEQAGSASDSRPGLQRLFVDLPFRVSETEIDGMAMLALTSTAAENHRPNRPSVERESRSWRRWNRFPSRARVWVVKGGPGQGKSTLGQYLCQIHRAALVLQYDKAVGYRDQELAREIRNAAQSSGFWPSVPRIPITIELKDYAYWYGSRVDQQRGILTFIAEKITIAVEQPISSTILRQALGSRSWIVVFDGLDEVPHGVKDKVASEVIHFIDGVAIEANSDMLTICTSRPQGYSGQFSALEAPTVTLTELDPKQALACAEPVVRYDRPEVEGEASMEMLRVAIGSASVSEIMKTPLQAHIMAIIVRDGGRPPERRWQLFTTFYQVIRRREANRNLPNQRLATLLREEEQLIKTVHNRLGFVLHARAETTQGAQTTLSRTEFRRLVEDAVAQLIDEGVVEFTETLMEATQERLVLVSTPDDGDHLRFDVRQLQEFFAAEFIFESVDAEMLRVRLSTIAGDAHWREVMHFVLSALVENGRRTELAVALQVIQELDGAADSGWERALRRRLGQGAILSSRLIQEGVLEQDKRYRNDFRGTILPLGGVSDGRMLATLASTSQQSKTKRWLVKVALESISENVAAESIGWYILLARLVNESDDQFEDVSNLVADLSNSELGAVAVGFEYQPYLGEDDPLFPRWFLRILLQRLATSEWLALGGRTIQIVLNYMREDIEEVAELLDLDRCAKAILKELADFDRRFFYHETSHSAGFVKVVHYSPDWLSGVITTGGPNWLALDERTSGLYELMRRLLRFASGHSYEDFREFIEMIGTEPDSFLALPAWLAAQVPLDLSSDLKSQLDFLEALSSDDLNLLLSSGRVRGFRPRRPGAIMGPDGTPFDLALFLITFAEYPEIAMPYFWDPQYFGEKGMPGWREDARIAERMIDIALENALVTRISLPTWGMLLTAGPVNGDRLRKALLMEAHRVPSVNGWTSGMIGFPLQVPQELPLVPHAVYAVVADEHFLYSRFFDEDELGVGSNAEKSERRRLAGLRIAEFFPDPDMLYRLILDVDVPVMIRNSAVIALLLHPQGEFTLDRGWHQLAASPAALEERWYLVLLLSVLDLISDAQSSPARELVSRLLSFTSNDHGRRQLVEKLLANWREQSFAPVQTKRLIDPWLSGVK